MFDMKNIVRAFRIHDITMLVLEKNHVEWDNIEEKQLVREIVTKYDATSRLVMQNMKDMDRKSSHNSKLLKGQK
jgi:hypothetical protein